MKPRRATPGEIEELVAKVHRRTGHDEAEIRRVIEILRGIEQIRSERAAEALSDRRTESILEQYERVPDLGQTFPDRGEALLREFGVAADQQTYARDLLIRVMVTVGIDEQAVRGFLYNRHHVLGVAPAEAIEQRGWGALDALLRLTFADPMS